MRRSGILKKYQWVEDQELYLKDMLLEIKELIIGTRAINTSFDSGALGSESFSLLDSDFINGWESINNRAVSPIITESFLDSFLYTDGYDEWYFFKEVPQSFDATAFCNYAGVTLDRAEELNFEGGCDLVSALNEFKPIVVAGWNEHVSYYLRENA